MTRVAITSARDAIAERLIRLAADRQLIVLFSGRQFDTRAALTFFSGAPNRIVLTRSRSADQTFAFG